MNNAKRYKLGMTQRFVRILSLLLVALSFSYCQGPNGRQVYGRVIGAPNQNQQFNTAVQQPFPQQLLSSMFSQKTQTPTSTLSTVDYKTPNWIDLCKDHGGVSQTCGDLDTDCDGISNQCETYLHDTGNAEYSALDPYVPNLALIGGRYFDTTDKIFNTQVDPQNSGKGVGVLLPDSKKVYSLFISEKNQLANDLSSWKALYYNYGFPIRVDDRLASYNRIPGLFNKLPDDQYIALARGDNDEAFPYAPQKNGDAAYYLTGIGKDYDSSLSQSFMEATEFQFVFPQNVDNIDITVGYLSTQSQNQIVGSTSGIYYVMNDGESIIFNNHDETTKTFGIAKKTPGCTTAQLTFVWLTNLGKNMKKNQLSAENFFYRTGPNEPWKNFTQGVISMQPRGGIACYTVYNNNDPKHDRMFFNVSSNITSRVPGIVDFNPGLGDAGKFDAQLVLDKDGKNLTNILTQAIEKIPSLDAAHLAEFRKAFNQIDRDKLSDSDKALYDQVLKALQDREDELAGKNKIMTAAVNPFQINLSKDGTIALSSDAMDCLKNLGFNFKDENGNDYTIISGQSQKITQATLDAILKQVGDLLDQGKITADKAACLALWIQALQNDPNVNQDSLNAWLAAHGDQLRALYPAFSLQDLIKYLRDMNKQYKLGLDSQIDALANAKTAADSKAAHDALLKSIETWLTDPKTLSTFPVKDRLQIAKDLKNKQFLTEDEYTRLIIEIIRLESKDKDTQVVQMPDGSLKLQNAKVLFSSGSNKLTPDGELNLTTLAQYISRLKAEDGRKDIYLEIDAFADSDGKTSTNQTLTDYRAQAVKDFLAGKANSVAYKYVGGVQKIPNDFQYALSNTHPEYIIPDTNIKAIGFGEDPKYFIATNKTKAGKAKNRRVEILILKNKP